MLTRAAASRASWRGVLNAAFLPRTLFTASPVEPQKDKWRWSAVLLFIPGLATFGLGTWQLQRRQWKVELLDYRRNRLGDAVVPLDVALDLASSDSSRNIDQQEPPKSALASLEFRRVLCEGTYAEDQSLYLGPRGRSTHGVTEKGYFLITPLLPVQGQDGSVQVPVLVNRGWVPGSWRNVPNKGTSESNTIVDTPRGKENINKGFFNLLWGRKHEISEAVSTKVKTAKVVGVVRGSETPNMFVPSNEPRSGQWFYVDVPAMARAVGLPENTIYVEALREEADVFKVKEFPDPKDPDALVRSSVMPLDHLSYAVTWYTLSAATTFMAWKRIQKSLMRKM